MLDLSTSAVFPDTIKCLCGQIALIAGFRQPLMSHFFGIILNNGHKPATSLHAYGAANARRHRRNALCHYISTHCKELSIKAYSEITLNKR